ncbi:MAG: hypothetical protein ACXWAB_13360 [Methylobacter sp.]
MIDRSARDKAAELLRQFLAGTITNFELENSWPSSADRVLREIQDTIWCFYDDFEEHAMRGGWKLSKKQKAISARWVLSCTRMKNTSGLPSVLLASAHFVRVGLRESLV